MTRLILLLSTLLISAINLLAQNLPLGEWNSHLPYKNARSVALSNNYLYTASGSAVFSYSLKDRSMKIYSKSEGLSDVGVSKIAYDTSTSTLIIAYSNSNIDLIQDGKVKNLPFIMRANITGSKEVFNIHVHEGIALLATGFGIVELRLEKQEIGDTYYFTEGASSMNVLDVWANDSYIYAASENGLYKGRRTTETNLVNFQNWELQGASTGLSKSKFTAITGREGDIYTSSGSTIYQLDGDYWMPFYNVPKNEVLDLFKGKDKLYISQESVLSIVPQNGSPQDITGQYYIAMPLQIIESEDGRVFYADLHRSAIEFRLPTEFRAIYPNGPDRVSSKGIDFLGSTAFIGSSPINPSFHPTFNAHGFYKHEDNRWQTYTESNLKEIEGAYDISVVQAIPQEKIVLLGAHNTGLIEFNPQSEQAKFIHNFQGASGNMRLTAATIDPYGNVWLANAYNTQALVCRKAGGEYIFFSSPLINNRLINGIAIDKHQQIWLSIADGGIVVFDYNGTLNDKSDDRFIAYTTTPGSGGLPTNSVTSIAADQEGQIWIGSIQGAFHVECPGAVFDRNCDAEQICVPRNDGTDFCDPLLETETITSIAVDAANRKWFGTTNGVFLKSADGYDNLHYFSEDNSPLLSNSITTIGIHPQTGDVYFLTSKGIITYRAEAIDQAASSAKPYAYPNPVRPDYHGPIAVKNLPLNADVKVTDAAGRLIVEGKALGSQFVWDGLDTFGKKVKTGIYYILSTSPDKKDKKSTKIAFIN